MQTLHVYLRAPRYTRSGGSNTKHYNKVALWQTIETECTRALKIYTRASIYYIYIYIYKSCNRCLHTRWYSFQLCFTYNLLYICCVFGFWYSRCHSYCAFVVERQRKQRKTDQIFALNCRLKLSFGCDVTTNKKKKRFSFDMQSFVWRGRCHWLAINFT